MKNGFEEFHGDSFKDGITVFKKEDGEWLSGTITLAGQKTIVDLLSEKFVGHNTTIEGWFDLVVFKDHRVEGDDPILLHNALKVGGGTFHRDIGHWRTKLYPNLIVYSADALGDGFSVRSVQFSLEHLEKFMPYQDVESHYVDNLDEDSRAQMLDMLRVNTNKWLNEHSQNREERNYDFDDPRKVHVEHNRPSELSFNVLGNDYELWGATSLSGGFGSACGRVFNSIQITFPEAMTIDKTLEMVEDCTRFFSQVVFEQLDLLAVSASGSSKPESERAEFYMPNLVRTTPKQSSPHIHSAYIPFTRWADRDKSIAFLSSWLKLDKERREFRRRVNATLLGRSGSDPITQIGTLCAAIDSLPDFKEPVEFGRETLKAMASAAHEVALKNGSNIELYRLRSVLGGLNRTRLRRKIEQLIDFVRPNLNPDERSQLIKQTFRLRQSAAHGQASVNGIEPYALPVSQALSAACVLYDLSSCGVGVEGFDSSILLANQTWQFAMGNLKTLSDNENNYNQPEN